MTNTEFRKEMINPETIDWPATQARMRLINKSAWAKQYGYPPGSVSMLLTGHWTRKTKEAGPVLISMISRLQEDGFLVVKEEQDVAA